MGLVNFLVGLALLTLGRRLFWLFVACVGFVAGVTSVQQAWGLSLISLLWLANLKEPGMKGSGTR